MSSGWRGRLIHWTFHNNRWDDVRLKGHTHSIFCLSKVSENQFLTNDYNGNNYIWTFESTEGWNEISQQRMETTHGNYQKTCIIDEESFAMINRWGMISYFQSNHSKYSKIIDFTATTGIGYDILFKSPYIIGMTEFQLLLINHESLEIKSISVENGRQILLLEDQIYVLTRSGIYKTHENCSITDEGQEI